MGRCWSWSRSGAGFGRRVRVQQAKILVPCAVSILFPSTILLPSPMAGTATFIRVLDAALKLSQSVRSGIQRSDNGAPTLLDCVGSRS
jgi:hypothetical protein